MIMSQMWSFKRERKKIMSQMRFRQVCPFFGGQRMLAGRSKVAYREKVKVESSPYMIYTHAIRTGKYFLSHIRPYNCLPLAKQNHPSFQSPHLYIGLYPGHFRCFGHLNFSLASNTSKFFSKYL